MFSFSHKVSQADVFAFGVIVLELITRRTVNIDRIPPREVESFLLVFYFAQIPSSR